MFLRNSCSSDEVCVGEGVCARAESVGPNTIKAMPKRHHDLLFLRILFPFPLRVVSYTRRRLRNSDRETLLNLHRFWIEDDDFVRVFEIQVHDTISNVG